MGAAREMQRKARIVLVAASEEAGGVPNRPVYMEQVMPRANEAGAKLAGEKEFQDVAMLLDGQGLFARGGDNYEMFVVTSAGISRAARS